MDICVGGLASHAENLIHYIGSHVLKDFNNIIAKFIEDSKILHTTKVAAVDNKNICPIETEENVTREKRKREENISCHKKHKIARTDITDTRDVRESVDENSSEIFDEKN